MHSVGNGNRTVAYDGKIAGLYDLEETLGSGHFAVVKLARHVFTGEKVAVKVIDKTKLDEVSRAHLFQEVRCMKLVQHPNVVRLYEVIDTQTKLYLILELGDGGDLYDYIMKHEGGLSENLAREYFRQIVRAISYCHQLHVVHRDLKPENVVFFEKLGVVKLTDFGFSNKFCPGQKLETSCGSLAYSAPEILLGDSYDAPAVDVWSLGVILYMLVCGQPPFEKANDSETLTMIMDCKYTMPAHVSPDCRRLISMMLVREPEKRASLAQIASDAWLAHGAQEEIVPEYLPLVSRQQVSDEDHTLIINKMVSGNIAAKEEILEALDRNEYNHITATYFLLAERKLRQHRQEQLQKRRPELSLPVSSSSRLSSRTRNQGMNRDMKDSDDSGNHLLVPMSNQLSTPRTPGAETAGGRSRKCSIVQEEDDEDEITGCSTRDELTTPLNRRGSRSEGRINLTIQDRVECERLKKEKDMCNVAASGGGYATKTKIISAARPVAVDGRNLNSSKSSTKGLENISGIKIVNKDTNNVRLRLGIAGGNNLSLTSNRIPLEIEKRFEKNLKTSDIISPSSHSSSSFVDGKRKNSIDQNLLNTKSFNVTSQVGDFDMAQTKVLIDSSTIQIPITTLTASNQDANIIPKYKTMPSPTRPTIVLSGPGTRELNEIFEEGTDVGSSDTSATTTPRPISRHSHFTSRSSSAAAPQRKSKFHKTRTPSCSSSDASDDDSESKKKRVHKIVDVSKPLQSQRRDSHDDSSDSQDQGNAPSSSGGGSNNTSSYLVCSTNNMGSNTTSSTNQNNSGHQTNKNGSSANTQNSISSSSITSNGSIEYNCEKTEQQKQLKQQSAASGTTTTTTHYRRHRAGRRRAGETRLRESQSLNRITEVQETTELPPINTNLSPTSGGSDAHHQQQIHSHNFNNNNNINNVTTNNSKINNNNDNNINNNCNNKCVNGVMNCSQLPSPSSIVEVPVVTVTIPTVITKPKGLSARLFQGFIKKNDFIQSQQASPSQSPMNDNVATLGTTTITSNQQQQKQKSPTTCGNKDGGNVKGIGVDNNHHSTTGTKTSSTTKKLKMLGRYFQVHKKICIPLPGLFQKGRLYKAQSCGSLVRDKVISTTAVATAATVVATTSLLTTTTTSTSLTTTTATVSDTKIMSSSATSASAAAISLKPAVLFTEKSKILRNCLVGAKYLGNNDSEGDINQNQNHHHNTILMAAMKKSSSSSTSTIDSKDQINGIECDSDLPTLLQQICSSMPTSAVTSATSSTSSVSICENSKPKINAKTAATILSVSTAQISINLPNFPQPNDDEDDDDSVVHEETSLHQLNDISLCSSKC